MLIIALLLSSIMKAEVVVLNNGHRIQGEILLQNEEVVIIKKKDGTRYQYPRSEVVAIQENSTIVTTQEEDTIVDIPIRPVALRTQLHGGAVYLPNKGWGGQIGVDLLIGSKEIAGKPMFIGGSIGYRAKILQETSYSFVPIQAVICMPLHARQHAPHIGMSIGYGISTSKTTKGGICLNANTGWTYRISDNSSLLLSCFAEWQQTQTQIIETINNQNYTNYIGANFITIGASASIQF